MFWDLVALVVIVVAMLTPWWLPWLFTPDPQRSYKRGYMSARYYTRGNPENPLRSHDIWSDYRDSYDRGWDDGVEAELRLQHTLRKKRKSRRYA